MQKLAVNQKIQNSYSNLIALVQTVPQNASSFNVDNIRVVKVLGAGVGSSHVMNGMVFRRGAEGDVKKVSNARIAVFACPFDLTQTETKGTVLMSNAEDLLQFSKTEESEVEEQVKALADRGVNLVVAAGKFGDIYLHYLNKYKIMGVRLVSKFDMRRLCRSIGAQAQARIVRIIVLLLLEILLFRMLHRLICLVNAMRFTSRKLAVKMLLFSIVPQMLLVLQQLSFVDPLNL